METEQVTETQPQPFEDYQQSREASGAPSKEGEAESAAASETAPQQTEEKTPPEGEDKDKPKGGFQRRIDRLTREKRELEAQLETARAAKPAEKPEAKPAEKPKRPDVNDFDDYHKYEAALEDYTEKLTEWKVDQKLALHKGETAAEAERREQSERARELQAQYEQRRKAVEKEIPTFAADIQASDMAETELPDHVTESILESEAGPKIIHHLATHPEELEALIDMRPLAAVRAIGKLESRFSPPAETKGKPVSKAPPPPKPGGAGKSAPNLESVTEFEEYDKLRRQQARAA